MGMFHYFCLPPVLLMLLLGYINRRENPMTRTALFISLKTATSELEFYKEIEMCCLLNLVPQTERDASHIPKVICN